MKNNITFNIIGSVIPYDILVRASNSKYTINKHFLSINPLSYVYNTESPNLTLPKVNREAYLSDINKTMFSELSTNKSDFLILDLLDCRLEVQKIKFGKSERTYIATANNGLLESLNDKDYEVTENINPLDISVSEWRKVLKKFVSELLRIYKPEQIIVVDIRPATFYISRENKKRYFKVQNGAKFMSLFDKLYEILKELAPKLKYIPCPNVWYCDEAIINKPFQFTLSSEYYEYALNSVKAFIDNDVSINIAKAHKECSDKSLERVQKSEKEWQNVELNNYNGIYQDNYDNFIDTGGCTISISLRGKSNHISIAPQCEIKKLRLTLDENNNVSIGEKTQIGTNCAINLKSQCSLTFDESVILKDNIAISLNPNSIANIGRLTQFGNYTAISSGKNCVVDIGIENVFNEHTELMLCDDAKLKIGNCNAIFKNLYLTLHSYTETIIKSNCLFSSEIKFINGDGHSIFDIETKRKLNDMKTASKDRRSIIINDHVWISRGAFLLNGTNIGEGSIVGAQSLVKKTFPNNCIVAGCPAKIIKRNVCWTRNNSTDDINSCEPYINMTKEVDE